MASLYIVMYISRCILVTKIRLLGFFHSGSAFLKRRYKSYHSCREPVTCSLSTSMASSAEVTEVNEYSIVKKVASLMDAQFNALITERESNNTRKVWIVP